MYMKLIENKFSDKVIDLASDYVTHCRINEMAPSYDKCIDFLKENIKDLTDDIINEYFSDIIKLEIDMTKKEVKSKIKAKIQEEKNKNECF